MEEEERNRAGEEGQGRIHDPSEVRYYPCVTYETEEASERMMVGMM